MCFSAEISFGAAAVIGTVGVLSFRKAKSNPFKLFSLIPIFFGIQQLSEGFVWMSFSNEFFILYQKLFIYLFILFAWVIWPFFIPFSFYKIEKEKLNKNLLLSLTFLGLIVSSLLFYVMIVHEVSATIMDCSIKYAYQTIYTGKWFLAIAYVTVTILPAIISSLRFAWILGVINLAGYFFSRIHWEDNVISVWCFFAAVSSILIYYFVHRHSNEHLMTQ